MMGRQLAKQRSGRHGRRAEMAAHFVNLGMDIEKQNVRRRRLLSYFSGPPFYGNRAGLIAQTRLTRGRVSQLFDEEQAFGERAAAQLAGRLGLPPDYFEYDHDEDAGEPRSLVWARVVSEAEGFAKGRGQLPRLRVMQAWGQKSSQGQVAPPRHLKGPSHTLAQNADDVLPVAEQTHHIQMV